MKGPCYQMIFWLISVLLCSSIRGSKGDTGSISDDYKIHFGRCHELSTNSTPDLLTLKGTWYLFAQTPKPLLSRCTNLTLLQDFRTGDYTLLEEFYSPIGYHTITYNVDIDSATNNIIFTQHIFGRLPIKTVWKVVEIVDDDFMLLQKCSAFSMLKESQMWVRNSHMAIDYEPVPKEFLNSMKKIHFTPNDYHLKRSTDCKS